MTPPTPAGEGRAPYATPRLVVDPADCLFYHTIDVPGYGEFQGQWDLRDGLDEYVGGLDWRGKRVLEIGTASGLLCFHMERRGAEVVAFDLSDSDSWDLVPYAEGDLEAFAQHRREAIRKMNNGYWLCHRAFGSTANVVYGSLYSVPGEIGPVDVSTFCSVLLHVRDPFLALSSALRLTRQTVVVTDLLPESTPERRDGAALPTMEFVPDGSVGQPRDSWWLLTPAVVQRFLGVLGFGAPRVTYHQHSGILGRRTFFTVVADRTAGSVAEPAAVS